MNIAGLGGFPLLLWTRFPNSPFLLMEGPMGWFWEVGLGLGRTQREPGCRSPQMPTSRLLISRENTCIYSRVKLPSTFLLHVYFFPPQHLIQSPEFPQALLFHLGLSAQWLPRQTTFFGEWFSSFIQEVKAFSTRQNPGMGRSSSHVTSCRDLTLLVVTPPWARGTGERQHPRDPLL